LEENGPDANLTAPHLKTNRKFIETKERFAPTIIAAFAIHTPPKPIVSSTGDVFCRRKDRELRISSFRSSANAALPTAHYSRELVTAVNLNPTKML
jgi:hypothetical protein